MIICTFCDFSCSWSPLGISTEPSKLPLAKGSTSLSRSSSHWHQLKALQKHLYLKLIHHNFSKSDSSTLASLITLPLCQDSHLKQCQISCQAHLPWREELALQPTDHCRLHQQSRSEPFDARRANPLAAHERVGPPLYVSCRPCNSLLIASPVAVKMYHHMLQSIAVAGIRQACY